MWRLSQIVRDEVNIYQYEMPSIRSDSEIQRPQLDIQATQEHSNKSCQVGPNFYNLNNARLWQSHIPYHGLKLRW